MKLIAGGDSFVWGSELIDHKHGGQGGYSLSTFPALLAAQHGLEYECVAIPGSGNDSIARRVIEACYGRDDVVVLASWTWSARYEFMFTHDNKWETVSARQYELGDELDAPHKKFIQSFFKNVGFSDYWETYSSLREITRLQDHLKARQIPYMFTIADNWFPKVDSLRQPDDVMRSMYEWIDWDRWYFFPAGTEKRETCNPRGFYQWACEQRYKRGPQLHPLEEAHLDAAQMMSDRFLTAISKRP
jgi:hypothetical protein